MATTWIVAADESRARVLQVMGREQHLEEVGNRLNGAREVGQYLGDARRQHRYDRLVLVAPPEFLGALRKELDKEVEQLVAGELPRDLSQLTAGEIGEYFAKGSARAL